MAMVRNTGLRLLKAGEEWGMFGTSHISEARTQFDEALDALAAHARKLEERVRELERENLEWVVWSESFKGKMIEVQRALENNQRNVMAALREAEGRNNE